MKRFSLKGKYGTLLQNTVMLAILQFSTYILALVAVPYETRVLGPEVYGILGAATAVMVYFQLVIDFGFLLSATEAASSHREDLGYLRKLLSSVTLCKLALAAISAAVLFALCQIIPAWRERTGLYFLFFLSTLFTSLMPDYLYRGLEKMTAITIRTVAIRAFFTVAIFIFLKKPEDLYVIPVLNIIGNGTACAAAYFDLGKRFKVTISAVTVKEVLQQFKSSAVFFLSRIATTAYTSLNTIILDMISAGGVSTGFYTSADKLVTTGKNLLSPVSDSMYPYMTKNRDFKLVKKVLLTLEPLIIAFCAVLFIWAEPICIFLLGREYGPTGPVLRAMLPVAVVTLPNYILGFPTLTAMGLSKYANYSVVFGSLLHVVNLGILLLTNHVNMMTLALLVSVAECAILAFRIGVIVKNRHLMKPKEDGNE